MFLWRGSLPSARMRRAGYRSSTARNADARYGIKSHIRLGFPIHYQELFVELEKEYAVVRLSKDVKLPLAKFLENVRDGVIANFVRFEDEVVRLCGGK